MWGRQLRAVIGRRERRRSDQRISASYIPRRASPHSARRSRRPSHSHRAISTAMAAAAALASMRNITANEPRAPTRLTSQGTRILGRQEASPERVSRAATRFTIP